jgi:hypothetical protein
MFALFGLNPFELLVLGTLILGALIVLVAIAFLVFWFVINPKKGKPKDE